MIHGPASALDLTLSPAPQSTRVACSLRRASPLAAAPRRQVVRCQATGGGGGGQWPDGARPPSAPRPSGERERSMLVNEEVVYFIFQLDLDTQLQRCLNYEAYEAAQEVRKKRTRVDEAVAAMRDRKSRNTGAPASATRLGAADFAAEGLRLRTEMQRAIEAENYSEAAKYRDLLKELETASKKAAALAAEWDTTNAGAGGPKLRLGQRVTHTQLGYRAVVVGWDAQCCESEDWISQSKADKLKGGIRQVFYHLLVDARDWEYDPHLPPVAYVAEELLTCPELDTAEDGQPGKSWSEMYGNDPLQHPYLYILFLGMDGRGDYVPCRQLRDKYSVQRRDVYRPGEEDKKD
ncbi:hypothetical protein HYH03_011796 [Edaphochlamys debaryana]|uniref:Hemimethylated DNA-binding domain-containing protein n=1 Tax=Edaphochlamys debaryana TaxID=47281 RepID=A0A836BV51_9CHLO|nr:hypothetical protein HYH03_011796 [Edaphochlamys debaryana]|eukprot:KAG2489687.1 hypothetical protein HYH03_011796 [Edaphochlamys debaryana]